MNATATSGNAAIPGAAPWQPVRDSLARMHAVAVLAFRSALRSRFVLCLAILILMVTVGLPATVAGDGTLGGTVRVLLNYTLGLTVGLLSVAMLWSACASIATEMQGGQLRLVRVRPVRALELWLGKWIGLLALSGALLALAGLGTYGMLQWQLHRSNATPAARAALDAQLLVGQRALTSRPEDITQLSEQRLGDYAAQGWKPDALSRRKALVLIRRRILSERATVAPGMSRTWVIDVPRHVPADASIALRIRISPGWGAPPPLVGEWRFASEGSSGEGHVAPAPPIEQGVGQVRLDPAWLTPGQPLRIEFANGPPGKASTVAFDPDDGITLLIRESSFGSNLARALLMIWFKIGLLCALGLAASTCFSFPVAAFCTSAVVLLALTGHYFTTNEASDIMSVAAQQVAKPSRLQEISESVLRGLEFLASPAVSQSPLAALSDGILISWGQTMCAFVVLLVLYSGVLAGASAWLLSRRELAAGTR